MPKWNMIVSRDLTSETPPKKRDWYFSFDASKHVLYLSGYREYQEVEGRFAIVKRYYPHTDLDKTIPIAEVPLPEDVEREAYRLFCDGVLVQKSVTV